MRETMRTLSTFAAEAERTERKMVAAMRALDQIP